MDAYSDSMIRLSNARLSELCRESAGDALARSVRAASVPGGRPAFRWRRRDRLVVEVEVDAPPVSLPTPTPAAAPEELRRSA
jgi:hypothetical protein